MTNKLPFDMKNYRAETKDSTSQRIGLCIVMITLFLALLSWMEGRDREHRTEMISQQCTNTGV